MLKVKWTTCLIIIYIIGRQAYVDRLLIFHVFPYNPGLEETGVERHSKGNIWQIMVGTPHAQCFKDTGPDYCYSRYLQPFSGSHANFKWSLLCTLSITYFITNPDVRNCGSVALYKEQIKYIIRLPI